MQTLPEVHSQDFVRKATGGGTGSGGGSVDVAGITKQVTSEVTKQVIPAATQATTRAVSEAIPALVQPAVQSSVAAAVPPAVQQATQGLGVQIKAGVKPADLYAEYQEGVWTPQLSEVVEGSGNSALFYHAFPKPFSQQPRLVVTPLGSTQRMFQFQVSAEGMHVRSNYSTTGVTLQWFAYVPKA